MAKELKRLKKMGSQGLVGGGEIQILKHLAGKAKARNLFQSKYVTITENLIQEQEREIKLHCSASMKKNVYHMKKSKS